MTNKIERKAIGSKIEKSKLILPYLTEVKTDIIGNVGDSPEIYTQINRRAGAGQIVAFSNKYLAYQHEVEINKSAVLAELNHPYDIDDDHLTFEFHFPKGPSTREAFILPNKDIDVTIVSSTCTIEHVKWEDNHLEYSVSNPGTQEMTWNKEHGEPSVSNLTSLEYSVEEKKDHFIITIKNPSDKLKVVVKGIN